MRCAPPQLANARGVTCVNDKDGWLGAAGLWQQLEAQSALTAARVQSCPHMLPASCARLAPQRFGSPLVRVGY